VVIAAILGTFYICIFGLLSVSEQSYSLRITSQNNPVDLRVHIANIFFYTGRINAYDILSATLLNYFFVGLMGIQYIK
jgi:hypothetical protein